MVRVPNLVEQLKDALKNKKEKNIACFVDGPNMLRKELGVDLEQIRKKLQYASDKLIEAVTNQGYDVVIVPSDVDVALAVEATEFAFNPNIDSIAIVSRDSDFKPLITKLKVHGKETIVVGTEPDFSSALKNSADMVIDAKG